MTSRPARTHRSIVSSKLLEDGRVRVEIELDAEALELFVRDAVERQVSMRLASSSFMSESSLRNASRSMLNQHVREAFGMVIPQMPPGDAFERAVQLWLDRREGWVAKMLGRVVKSSEVNGG